MKKFVFNLLSIYFKSEFNFASQVLYCCYNLGHNTEKEEVFTSAVKIIHRFPSVSYFLKYFFKFYKYFNRDFNFMSGLAIVQACLSLSFYKVLPGNMISRVFSINFIKRLEEEIKMSYSKVTTLFIIFLNTL